MRRYLAVAVFLTLSGPPAQAQFAPAVQACTGDAAKHCSNSGFADCIKLHFAAFSDACKTALVRRAAVSSACADDIAKQCPSTKPGSGRVLLCVKSHYATLSYECRAVVGQASQRRL